MVTISRYTTIYTNGSWNHIIKDGDDNQYFLDATSNVPETNKLSMELFFYDSDTFGIYSPDTFIHLQSDGTWALPEHRFTISANDSIDFNNGVHGRQTIEGIYFITSEGTGYWTGPFPPTNATNFTPTSSTAVCFLEGTDITTDQGPVAIEQLTQYNTIYGSKVNNITESNNFFGHLIHFKPNALANNLPSTDTFLTPTHAIFCPKDKCMKMAKDFCDGENVVEDFTKDKTCKIYNVVCEDDNGDITAHSMYVNNMLCECLHPHAYPLVKNQLKW